MFGAAVAIARDHGVAGFFRGWLPFYLRAPRPKERLDMAVFCLRVQRETSTMLGVP